jgi:hypothetical protein
MAMSHYFPEDIIAYIVQFADVPIDTSLAFGVKPKKIILPDGIEDKLNSLCTRRLKFSTKYKSDIEKMKNSSRSYKICYSTLEQVSTILDDIEVMCKYFIDMDGEYCYDFLKYTSDTCFGRGPYRINDGSKIKRMF